MAVRQPIVAGRFYPAQAQACQSQVAECTAPADSPALLPRRIVGGLVPHAGWMCSGRVAGRVLARIAEQRQPDTLVLFGADHSGRLTSAAMFASGCWQTPIGDLPVDEHLAEEIARHVERVDVDESAHAFEHSLEVQMPFIRAMFPEARVLPIMVPPMTDALRVGEQIGEIIVRNRMNALVVGTTDLTHYGPSYAFTPQGVGQSALHWAKAVNDRRILDLLMRRDAAAIVPEATQHRNACGAGAVAATVAASVALGADRTVILEHTTSSEVLGGRGGEDAVGYAGVVFGTDVMGN